MRGIVLLVFLFLMNITDAQPLARYNLYPFNPSFANPAATGYTDCWIFNATDMHQWVGIEDAPSVQSFSIQKGRQFSKTKKHGLGLNMFRDANGPSKSLGGELIYSFHVQVGRNSNSWLAFGLSGNIEQRRLDESGFSPLYDPLVTGAGEREWAYNASCEVIQYNEKYTVGVAVYNLFPANNTLGTGYGSERFFFSIQGGYLFSSRRMPLKIHTSLQGGIGKDIYQFDLTNRIYFKNNSWTALTVRKYLGAIQSAGQDAIVYIGYEWNNWSVSYNYCIDINGTQFHHYGTHQLAVGYKICRDKYSCPTYK